MASRIKGITIEIDGDATGLEKALSGVNKTIRENQAALKDTERLLKLNPGSTELLTQKQSYLTNEIDATKAKLEQEKAALAQLEAGPQTEKTLEQQRALRREIEDTTQKLNGLTDEYKEFGSVSAQQLKAAGEKVKEVGGKVSDVGEGLTKNVTAPIVALGAASTAAWNEVDSGLDIITTKTGATGEALADMQERAKNLATSIPTDFETAGSAIGEVNTRFGLTGQQLEDLSGKFIKFAKLNDTDVSTSIDTVQMAMAAFNLDASHAGDMLDILNKAGQDTGISVDSLAQIIATNATALQEMGLSAQDSAMFIANLEKSGVDTSATITGLKAALKNATKEGKTVNEAMTEMQDAMDKAATKTEAMQIATELFGSKAGPALGAACYEGRLSLDALGLSLDEFTGNVENTFEEAKDPMDDFQSTLNELKIVGADLVEAAAPLIKDLAAILKEVFGNLRKWWESLSPAMQETIIKLAAITAAVGPVLVVVGKLTTAIGSILTYAPKVAGAFGMIKGVAGPLIAGAKTALTGLFALIQANPVIAVITAVVAGLVLLYNNCEWFRDAVHAVIDAVIGFFQSMGEGIATFCQGLGTWWESVKMNTAETWNSVTESVGTAWNNLATGAAEKFEGIRSTVAEKWEALKASTSETWGNIQASVAENAGLIWQTVSEKFGAIWNKTTEIFSGIHDTITQKIGDARDFIKGAIDQITSFFAGAKLEFPHIKLPHFSISGSFSLNPPSSPHIGVEWYKKAYDQAYLFNSPTVLPTAGGMKGFGDGNGSEIVAGTDLLRGMIQDGFSQLAGAGGDIIIPVNIGNERIDTIVVKAADRVNFRSGGR